MPHPVLLCSNERPLPDAGFANPPIAAKYRDCPPQGLISLAVGPGWR
jgi:hypothetical protein